MKVSPGTIGFPVAVGAVTIASGDVLVGDRDGVVVVRQDEIGVAVAGYLAVRAREAEMAAIVGTGTVPAWLAETIAKIGIDRVGD